MPSVADKRRAFRALHERGCFVIPNPWRRRDSALPPASRLQGARLDQRRLRVSEGLPDNAVSREIVLAHLREIVGATDVPVNADFEGGFADAPDGVAESVTLAVATGVAGLSIEDFDRRQEVRSTTSISRSTASAPPAPRSTRRAAT